MKHALARCGEAASRWFLIATFAWSAGGKLLWPGEFKNRLTATGLVRPAIAVSVAYLLPWLEISLALALAVRFMPRLLVPVTCFLTLVFCGIHAYAAISGDVMNCGCIGLRVTFESRAEHVGTCALAGLMAVAAFGLLSCTSRTGLNSSIRAGVQTTP